MGSAKLDARKVEPKAIRRWLKGGLTLTYNATFSWACWSVLCSMLIVLVSASPFLRDLVFYSFLLTGFSMASWIDKGKARSNYEGILIFLKNLGTGFKYGLLATSLLVAFEASYTLLTDSTVSSLFYNSDYNFPNMADGILPFLSSVSNSIYLSSVILIMITALPLFTHPFGVGSMLLYDADYKIATGLVIDGMDKNFDAMAGLMFLFLLMGVLLTEFLPILTLLVLLPIISSTFWVAFKDVYLHEDTVEEKESIKSFDMELIKKRATSPTSLCRMTL